MICCHTSWVYSEKKKNVVHESSGDTAPNLGDVLHIQLNRTICTVCSPFFFFLPYQHFAVSPSTTNVSLWIYGGNSSLFNFFPEDRGRDRGWAWLWTGSLPRGETFTRLRADRLWRARRTVNLWTLRSWGYLVLTSVPNMSDFQWEVLYFCWCYFPHVILFFSLNINKPQTEYVFGLRLEYNYQLPCHFLNHWLVWTQCSHGSGSHCIK